MRTRDELRILQALPLSLKVAKTKLRVREWINQFGEDGVYLSWSGGKDSTVLRHIIMQDWPNVESVFVNTGLEYPEIQRFVRDAKDRGEPVTILRPKMSFVEVIKKYGYPVISKRVAETVKYAKKNIQEGKLETVRVKQLRGEAKLENGNGSLFNAKKYAPLVDLNIDFSSECCAVMKKAPFKKYQKQTGRVPIIGTMASESVGREANWLQFGCNAFRGNSSVSAPMSFWTEQDVLAYIKTYGVEIPSVYGEIVYAEEPDQVRWEEITNQPVRCDSLCTTGCSRTGCIFCLFGAHLEKGEGRLERLKRTHPRQYEYCIGGGEYGEDGIWRPNKEGLGMGHVIDELNKIYGDGFIKY